MFTPGTRSKYQHSKRGQSTIVIIVIVLILLIIGIIAVPRVMRRLNIKLPDIPRPRLTAVDVSAQPTNDENVLPAQTTPSSVISNPNLVISPTLAPTTISSPTGVNFIEGEIRIVNHSGRSIDKVEVNYCGQANVAKEDQTCITTDFKNENGEANTLWYLYSSTPHNFYHYQLNFDSKGNPMEKGILYTIAWAQATVDGQTFQSDEKWVNVQFPGKTNFTVVLPSK